MKKTMLVLLMVLCLVILCSCSKDKMETRQTYYEVVEGGNADEIKAASAEAEEKSGQLISLARDYIMGWNDYQSGVKTLEEMRAVRQPLIDFLVSQGFAESYFTGTDENVDEMIEQFRGELYEEYLAVMTAAKDIMKQEAVDKFTK